MKSTLRAVLLYVKTLMQQLIPLSVSPRVLHEIPYFSQWESPQLVDKILAKEISAKDDPLWKRSGATSEREYVNWSWSVCGMACLKMVLATELHSVIPILNLAHDCEKHGGYKINTVAYTHEEFQNAISGLIFKPCVDYLQTTFQLSAFVNNYMTRNDIISAIYKKQYVIVSVNAKIRDPQSQNSQKGGHLVLITGYDIRKKILYLHNPSGYYGKSQKNAAISFYDFDRFFANRGIVILSKNST